MNTQDRTGDEFTNRPAESDLRENARRLLASHWRTEGYTMPNRTVYPWQWLWDSCFHAIVWAALGDDRALVELDRMFTAQTASGFVPHMTYHPDPAAAREIWGRSGASTITQPPMFGHAIAELDRRGFEVPDATVEAASRGLRFLVERRRRTDGLIEICHPWETGCDDSPRWDDALDRPWSRARWRDHKFALLGEIESDPDGAALANPAFAVGSVGFTALVAFNVAELARVTGDTAQMAVVRELRDAIADRWDEASSTWIDSGPFASGSGRVRTTDTHFALLVDDVPHHRTAALAELTDPRALGAAFGPRGVHRAEPAYDPNEYWRGPAWPQMTYLIWVALVRGGEIGAAQQLAAALVGGAQRSGFAEYWHPDTGAGLGAIPQSWAALAVVVDEERRGAVS